MTEPTPRVLAVVPARHASSRFPAKVLAPLAGRPLFAWAAEAALRADLEPRLQALGVGIVIDDYGTGACTLAHLSQSPATAIKIDLSFVANMASSKPVVATGAPIATSGRRRVRATCSAGCRPRPARRPR